MDNLAKVLKKWHEISEKLEDIQEVLKFCSLGYGSSQSLEISGVATKVGLSLSKEEVLEILYRQEEKLREEFNKIEKSLEGATKIAKELVGE